MKYGSVIEEYHALQTHLNFIIDLTGNLAKMSSTMWSWIGLSSGSLTRPN